MGDPRYCASHIKRGLCCLVLVVVSCLKEAPMKNVKFFIVACFCQARENNQHKKIRYLPYPLFCIVFVVLTCLIEGAPLKNLTIKLFKVAPSIKQDKTTSARRQDS
jgi:hypothetical protein